MAIPDSAVIAEENWRAFKEAERELRRREAAECNKKVEREGVVWHGKGEAK